MIREDRTLLLRINDVYMFRPDAVDIANGHATIEDVRGRNKCKVFPNSPYEQDTSGSFKWKSGQRNFDGQYT